MATLFNVSNHSFTTDRHEKSFSDIRREFSSQASSQIANEAFFSGLLTPYKKTNSADVRSDVMRGQIPVLFANNGVFSSESDVMGYIARCVDASVFLVYPSFSAKKNYFGYSGIIYNVVWDGHEGFLRRLKADAKNIRVRKWQDLIIKVDKPTSWTKSGYPDKFTTVLFTPQMIESTFHSMVETFEFSDLLEAVSVNPTWLCPVE